MKIKYLALCALLSAGIGSALAENIDQNEWSITPYFWLPSMDVTSTIGGQSVDLDLGFDDIWDTFDVFALSARGEYWRGQWGAVVDGIWMDMKTDGEGPMGNPASLQLSDGVLDLLGAWRVNLTDDEPELAVSARLLAGLRYHYLKQEVNAPAPIGTLGGSEDWVELVIAGQLVAPLGDKWVATVRGDASGFGIGDGSEITSSLMAGAGWRFADQWIAKLGYRVYIIDYSTGSGASEFGLDGGMHGPWIGISYGM